MTQWLSSLQQFSVVCKFHCSHQTMLESLFNRRRKSSTHKSHHLLVSPHSRLPIPSPSSSHRHPFTISNHFTKGLPKACPSLKLLVSVSSALTPFPTGNRKTGNRCPLPCLLRAILRGGELKQMEDLDLLRCPQAALQYFWNLCFSSWRFGEIVRTMEQRCLPIWGGLFVHAPIPPPSFTQRARDSPGDGVRRRKSETDFQNRFSEEGHVDFYARRARGKEKSMHAYKRTCQALVSRHGKTQSQAGDCAAYESYVYRAFCG